LRKAAEILLILGTALTIYWQPLGRQFSLKPSDVVFMLALGASMLFLLQERRMQGFISARQRLILPLFALLGFLIMATLVGYLRYDLTMSREGIALLVRLMICMALFLIIHSFAQTDISFVRRISLALLSPILLLPSMMVPSFFVSMWEVGGRFRGFTVNPNTADLGFSIGLAFAYTLTMYEMNRKRRLRASGFAIVALVMLLLIVLTQSRAYVAGAISSALLSAVLTASNLRLPKLKVAAGAALGFPILIAATLLIAPRSLMNSYLPRMSLEASPAQQAEALSNWTRIVPQFRRQTPSAVARKLMENPHVQAAVYYSELLSSNYLGLGLNYEKKFFIVFPWINRNHHGTNSILDIPVYGGVGAVLSLGYLALLVARNIREKQRAETDETTPYAIAAAAALGGIWVAAIFLGSPIFDYQFWIITAIALT
jgi:hypothetical protein